MGSGKENGICLLRDHTPLSAKIDGGVVTMLVERRSHVGPQFELSHLPAVTLSYVVTYLDREDDEYAGW